MVAYKWLILFYKQLSFLFPQFKFLWISILKNVNQYFKYFHWQCMFSIHRIFLVILNPIRRAFQSLKASPRRDRRNKTAFHYFSNSPHWYRCSWFDDAQALHFDHGESRKLVLQKLFNIIYDLIVASKTVTSLVRFELRKRAEVKSR